MIKRWQAPIASLKRNYMQPFPKLLRRYALVQQDGEETIIS